MVFCTCGNVRPYAAVVICAFVSWHAQAGPNDAQAVPAGFTASPERRAELLAQVCARDQAWEAAKPKGPALTIVREGLRRHQSRKEQEAFYGTEIDVTGHLKPGAENQITVQVRHIPLPELFLGGIVQPVYLIEKAE